MNMCVLSSSCKNKNGYILILSLSVLSGLVVLMTYLFVRGSFFITHGNISNNTNRATFLAYGGLQIACAQLANAHKKLTDKDIAQTKEAAHAPSREDKAKQFLISVVPGINRVTEYKLSQDIDGIDGTIIICCMSEEGKIDINAIYDYTKRTFTLQNSPEKGKAFMEFIGKQIENISGAKNIYKGLETFLRDRTYPVQDVTELLTIPEFNLFNRYRYYQPATHKDQKRPVYITDIFTVDSKKKTVSPWLLSDSLLGIFSMKRAELNDGSERKKQINEWVKNIKYGIGEAGNIKAVLEGVYTKKIEEFPIDMVSFFESSQEPSIFSFLIEGIVGTVTVRLYAIVERMKNVDKSGVDYTIQVKKLYWI